MRWDLIIYFGIFFKAYKEPVFLWITWKTEPNLPSPRLFPITKSHILGLLPIAFRNVMVFFDFSSLKVGVSLMVRFVTVLIALDDLTLVIIPSEEGFSWGEFI